jgi:hypothetical protein
MGAAAGIADSLDDLPGDASRSSMSWHLIGWAACNMAGLSVALCIPLWIAEFPARVGLGSWSGGAAASLELLSAVLANILWSAFMPRYPMRWLAAGLAAVLALAQQLASFSLPAVAFSGLALAGLCAGSLLAIFNKQVANTDRPHRGFATLAFLQVLFQVTVFVTAPRLQAWLGPNILFTFLTVVDLLGCALIIFLPRGRRVLNVVAIPLSASGVSVPGMLGLFGLATLLMGSEVLTAYIVRLGQPLSLTRLQVSGILAMANAVGFGGTPHAGVLPAKAGFARLITVSLLVIALLDTAIGLARTPVLFAIAFVIIQTSLVFAVPRIISYLAILDSTGRSAGMSPASILIGAALGPILGSFIGAPSVMEWVPYTASASTLIAMVLFFVIPVVRKRYQRE